jgi:hypothetical protein
MQPFTHLPTSFKAQKIHWRGYNSKEHLDEQMAAWRAGALAARLDSHYCRQNPLPSEVVFKLSAHVLNPYRSSVHVMNPFLHSANSFKVMKPSYNSIMYNQLCARYSKDAMILRKYIL